MFLSDICVYLNEIIYFILGDPYNFIDGAICIEMSHRCLSLYGPLAISEPAHGLRGSMAGIQLSFRLNNHDIKIVDNLFVHFLKISNIVSSTWGQKRFKCCPWSERHSSPPPQQAPQLVEHICLDTPEDRKVLHRLSFDAEIMRRMEYLKLTFTSTTNQVASPT